MTVLRSKTVVVRKPHDCVWCGQTIQVGETAEATTCKDADAGQIFTSHSHPECSDAMLESGAFDYDDSADFNWLVDNLDYAPESWRLWFVARFPEVAARRGVIP